jgi:hypothetical protein
MIDYGSLLQAPNRTTFFHTSKIAVIIIDMIQNIIMNIQILNQTKFVQSFKRK